MRGRSFIPSQTPSTLHILSGICLRMREGRGGGRGAGAGVGGWMGWKVEDIDCAQRIQDVLGRTHAASRARPNVSMVHLVSVVKQAGPPSRRQEQTPRKGEVIGQLNPPPKKRSSSVRGRASDRACTKHQQHKQTSHPPPEPAYLLIAMFYIYTLQVAPSQAGRSF